MADLALVLLLAVAVFAAVPDPLNLQDTHHKNEEKPSPKSTTRDEYQPSTQNVYHLFTRLNPSISQPQILGQATWLVNSNFAGNRRTVIIIHDWQQSVNSDVTFALVPAILAREDVNVFSVDWSAGSLTEDYVSGIINSVLSGESVAEFVNWLIQIVNVSSRQFTTIGHGLGAHIAGIISRNLVDGQKALHVIALDPSLRGWSWNEYKLDEEDAEYTEAIYTNAGVNAFVTPLAHVNMYPNGGMNQPGCTTDDCSHNRAIHLLAESFFSGGFTAVSCEHYQDAMYGSCNSNQTINMGGLQSKFGYFSSFSLQTNAVPPYSRG